MAESEQEWIYAVGSDRKGPVSAREIGMLVSSARLGAKTLVWKPGMADWTPADDVPEIAALLAPPLPKPVRPPTQTPVEPPPIASQRVKATTERTTAVRIPPPPPAPKLVDTGGFFGGPHHPWRRYFAKVIDVSMLGIPGFLLLGLVTRSDQPTNLVVAGVLGILFASPVEALCISLFRATPGKWLFGISVLKLGGSNLGFVEAWARTLRVAVQGMGLGIPILSMVPNYLAYRRLASTGTTLWDTASGAAVMHAQWGPLRWVSVVSAMIAWSLLMSILIDVTAKPASTHAGVTPGRESDAVEQTLSENVARLSENACERGDADACFAAAAHAEQRGDLDAQRKFDEKGCDLGDCLALIAAANKTGDRDEERRLYKKQCDLGGRYGSCLWSGDNAKSRQEAQQFYERGCDQGEAASCQKVGRAAPR